MSLSEVFQVGAASSRLVYEDRGSGETFGGERFDFGNF